MDRIIDFIPDFLEKANCSINKMLNKKDENKEERKSVKSIKQKPKNIKEIEIEYDDTNDITEYLEDE